MAIHIRQCFFTISTFRPFRFNPQYSLFVVYLKHHSVEEVGANELKPDTKNAGNNLTVPAVKNDLKHSIAISSRLKGRPHGKHVR